MVAENDRINGILKGRLNDLEEWKGRCQDLERTIDKYIVLEQDKRELERIIDEKNRGLEERDRRVVQLEEEFERRLPVLEDKLRAEQSRNGELVREVDRLNNSVKSKSGEC